MLIACLLLLALGLTSAAPQFPYNFQLKPTDLGLYYDLDTQGKEQSLENEANNQVVSAVAALPFVLPPLISIGKAALKHFVCEAVTQYADSKERDAQIMALGEVVDEWFGVTEADKLNMKNNHIAKAELFDWAKEVAKDYLCN